MNLMKRLLESLLQWTIVVGEVRAKPHKKGAWY